MKSLQ